MAEEHSVVDSRIGGFNIILLFDVIDVSTRKRTLFLHLKSDFLCHENHQLICSRILTASVVSPTQLYLVQQLSFGETAPDGIEQIRCVKMQFRDALEMVVSSEITHGPSCVLILKSALSIGIVHQYVLCLDDRSLEGDRGNDPNE